MSPALSAARYAAAAALQQMTFLEQRYYPLLNARLEGTASVLMAARAG